MNNNEYTFPFSTCEKPTNNIIAQPFSALVNIFSCILIIYFLCKSKSIYSFIFLFSLLCFELFHTFSHCIHIEGYSQSLIIHSIAYFANASLLLVLYNKTKKILDTEFILFLSLFVCLDIYSILNLTFIFSFITQIIIFLGILFYFFHLLPNYIQNIYYPIIGFTALIVFFEINEINNCNYMYRLNPYFPYHIIVESIGFVLFYIICSQFYKL